MADCEEIEAGHAPKRGKGRERNWKDEEIEMLITLYEERPCSGTWVIRTTWTGTISIWAFLSDSYTFVVQTSYYHTRSSYFWGFLLVERHI